MRGSGSVRCEVLMHCLFIVISSAAELSANADDPAESRNLLFARASQGSSTSLGMTVSGVLQLPD